MPFARGAVRFLVILSTANPSDLLRPHTNSLYGRSELQVGKNARATAAQAGDVVAFRPVVYGALALALAFTW